MADGQGYNGDGGNPVVLKSEQRKQEVQQSREHIVAELDSMKADFEKYSSSSYEALEENATKATTTEAQANESLSQFGIKNGDELDGMLATLRGIRGQNLFLDYPEGKTTLQLFENSNARFNESKKRGELNSWMKVGFLSRKNSVLSFVDWEQDSTAEKGDKDDKGKYSIRDAINRVSNLIKEGQIDEVDKILSNIKGTEFDTSQIEAVLDSINNRKSNQLGLEEDIKKAGSVRIYYDDHDGGIPGLRSDQDTALDTILMDYEKLSSQVCDPIQVINVADSDLVGQMNEHVSRVRNIVARLKTLSSQTKYLVEEGEPIGVSKWSSDLLDSVEMDNELTSSQIAKNLYSATVKEEKLEDVNYDQVVEYIKKNINNSFPDDVNTSSGKVGEKAWYNVRLFKVLNEGNLLNNFPEGLTPEKRFDGVLETYKEFIAGEFGNDIEVRALMSLSNDEKASALAYIQKVFTEKKVYNNEPNVLLLNMAKRIIATLPKRVEAIKKIAGIEE
ncbi:MAG: hypothetical protein WCJ19_01155 [bacterium]